MNDLTYQVTYLIKFLLQATVTYSSTYVLVALSIDRYDAITHPMNFSGSCKYRFCLSLKLIFRSVNIAVELFVFYETKHASYEVWKCSTYMTAQMMLLTYEKYCCIQYAYTQVNSPYSNSDLVQTCLQSRCLSAQRSKIVYLESIKL